MERPARALVGVLFVFVVVGVFPARSFGLWVDNGNALCTVAGDQSSPQITSDGSGGAIVTWIDGRIGNNGIYAQRVDASGVVQWTANGVALCTATGNRWVVTITSDGSGGAIVTWHDNRSGSYDVYAQRVNASGVVQWAADGVVLCAATGSQGYPQITSDGSGGAIVTWDDDRNGSYDVYAQRVNASGVVQWAADGVVLCAATGDQEYPAIISDGAGGAIVTWSDYLDVYAQRVNASGVVQWAADGVVLCTATGDQEYPAIASDGAGGAIVTWDDWRSGSYDVYAQRVNASGVVQWAAGGVPLCTATGSQSSPKIASDGSGGAIVTWDDWRSWSYDIYAQRVNASGVVQWVADGVALCAATGDQEYPAIASDGAGGAIVTWDDDRSGSYDVYTQRVNASGVVQWAADGVVLCAATGTQQYPAITSDGAGGAIVTWEDWRSGSNSDVYAQRVPTGVADVSAAPTISTSLAQNIPNPFNPVTSITFSVAVPGEVSLRIYDVAGRVLRTLVEGWREPGVYKEIWDGGADDGSVLPSGVYFYSLKTGELVVTHKMVLLK